MFTLSTLLASPYAFGQPEVNGGKPGIVFEPIIVTGEKLERELKDTASSVSIKTAKEIDKEKTGSASVAEVLNDVPNVIYTDSVGAPIIRGQDTQGRTTARTCSGAAPCHGRQSTLTAIT